MNNSLAGSDNLSPPKSGEMQNRSISSAATLQPLPDRYKGKGIRITTKKLAQQWVDTVGWCLCQALFRRAQLKALVDAHGLKEGLGGNLSHDEITVIRGALDLTHKTAADCMTPWDKVNPRLRCLFSFKQHRLTAMLHSY